MALIKPTIYDLAVLKTYINHALEELRDPLKGSEVEAMGFLNDALAEIERLNGVLEEEKNGKPKV